MENLNRRGLAWPRGSETLDVVVAPGNIERAMCIAQAIADALEERGGELSAKPGEEPAALINGERIEFSMAEKFREMTAEERQTLKEERGENYLLQRNLPTGKLSLSLGYTRKVRKTFNDGEIQRVEDVLNKFFISLWKLSVHQKRKRRKREIRKQRRKKRKRRQRRAKRRQDQLKEDSEDWRKAERIRTYVEAVKDEARKRDQSIEPVTELGD